MPLRPRTSRAGRLERNGASWDGLSQGPACTGPCGIMSFISARCSARCVIPRPDANCYSCHVGKDGEGIVFFQNRREVETLKVGFKCDDPKAPGAGYRDMLVRHVPVDPMMFDFYGKDGFTNFGNVPTWKRASPHNIQRRTCRRRTQPLPRALGDLELRDLLDYEKQANKNVVVPDGKCELVEEDPETRHRHEQGPNR